MPEEIFVKSLQEAVHLSILEERSQVGSIRYRFTHAFFRQTLYEEMIAPKRLQLHQQVARVLENQYANRLEEHAAELAEHFSQSTDPADLEKAVKYSEMAAKRAVGVYAYGEAARLLERAVEVQKVFNPNDKGKQCNLLLDLCDALILATEYRRVLDVETPAAFALAENMGDRSLAARACIKTIYAIACSDSPQVITSGPQFVEWSERADRYALPGTPERGFTDAMLGIYYVHKRRYSCRSEAPAPGS
jgi:predicted ATPase